MDYIDLLPDPANEGSWTIDLPTVDIADDTVFTFDGQTTAAQVTIEDLDPHQLGTSFSISTWMKHDSETQDLKEHILCAADGEGGITLFLNYFLGNTLRYVHLGGSVVTWLSLYFEYCVQCYEHISHSG